jgi:hypothetical protein
MERGPAVQMYQVFCSRCRELTTMFGEGSLADAEEVKRGVREQNQVFLDATPMLLMKKHLVAGGLAADRWRESRIEESRLGPCYASQNDQERRDEIWGLKKQ